MALLPQALTTLAKVHAMLGIPDAVTTDDTYLTDLINAATRFIERETGRKLVRRNYNGAVDDHSQTDVDDEDYIIFSGKGHYKHSLPQFPISSAGFVLEELTGRVNGTPSWATLTEDDDYVLDRETGIITMLVGCFGRGDRNYRVTCAAGYQEAAVPWVPDDLEMACRTLVRETYKEQDRLTSEKIGDISRSYDVTQHRKLVENTIENYRADSNFM